MTTPVTRAMPRLQRLATRDRPVAAVSVAAAEEERCGLCAAPVGAEHPHLMEVRARTLLCACRACAVLFDRRAAGMGQYRLVPDRCQVLTEFTLSEPQWASLGVPVAMAFFTRSTAAGGVVAFYPGPLGATEAAVDVATWAEIERDNAALATLEDDVEALLVDRRGPAPEHWLVAIDRAYALVGVMRRHWKGLGGGAEVQEQIARFFADLRRRSTAGG